eukprot:gene8697-5294_t
MSRLRPLAGVVLLQPTGRHTALGTQCFDQTKISGSRACRGANKDKLPRFTSKMIASLAECRASAETCTGAIGFSWESGNGSGDCGCKIYGESGNHPT